MPMLNCYVDDDTLRRLERYSEYCARPIIELAESAISEAAIHAMRDLPAPTQQEGSA